MNALAVITARGGSKRIPHKNKKEFCGKPIMQYSIEAALESGIFAEVMVSTDDEEIAEIGRRAGASVPFMRSEETANDFATTAMVLEEVLAEYEKIGKTFDYVCCVYPTAPFVTGTHLKEAMDMLESLQADSVVPVVRFGFPPQRGVRRSEDGTISFIQPEHALTRSQDLEPIYHDCGQFYCLNVAQFKEQGCLVMKNTAGYIRPESQVQDIDTMEDWKIAEMKYKLQTQATE